jgi:enamine deaminase RidA (YjgF/YER057c/UK114 family)
LQPKDVCEIKLIEKKFVAFMRSARYNTTLDRRAESCDDQHQLFAFSVGDHMHLVERLTELGIELPTTAAPGAQYSAGVVHGDLVWISGQLPRDGDRVLVAGQVGRDVTIAQAQEGARIALLRALAALRDTVGDLQRVRQIVTMNVFVQSCGTFTQQSAVADGASALIFALLGPESGKHARTSVGVAQLPRNACVELDLVVVLDSA